MPTIPDYPDDGQDPWGADLQAYILAVLAQNLIDATAAANAATVAAVTAKNQAIAARDIAVAQGGGYWTVDADPASFRGSSTGTPDPAGTYLFTRFNITQNLPLNNLTCVMQTPTTGGANGVILQNPATPLAGFALSVPSEWSSDVAVGTTATTTNLTEVGGYPVVGQLRLPITGIAVADFPTTFTFASTDTPNRTVKITATLNTSAAPYVTFGKITTMVN